METAKEKILNITYDEIVEVLEIFEGNSSKYYRSMKEAELRKYYEDYLNQGADIC